MLCPLDTRKHFLYLNASCNWLLWLATFSSPCLIHVTRSWARSFPDCPGFHKRGLCNWIKGAKSKVFCSHPGSNLLAVPVFLNIFICRMVCVVLHTALCNKVPVFRIWNLPVSNLFRSAVKITFVAVKLVPNGHLLFLLYSHQVAGRESAELKIF